MSNHLPAHPNPDEALRMRLTELGAARARVAEAVGRLPLPILALESKEYEHTMRGLNQQLVFGLVDELATVEASSRNISHDNALYTRSSYYQRYVEKVDDVRLVLPDSLAASHARTAVLWTGLSARNLAAVAPPTENMESQSPDEYGHKRPNIRVRTEVKAPSEAISVLPFYVVGEKPLGDGLTGLLLALPAFRAGQLKVNHGLFSTLTNTMRWDIHKKAGADVVPIETDIQATYNPTTGRYEMSARGDTAAVAKAPHDLSWTNKAKLDNTTNRRKAAKLPLQAWQPSPLPTVSTEDFETYGVLNHLVELSGGFAATDLLNSLLAKRATQMPVSPADRMLGVTDYVPTLELDQVQPTISSQLGRLASRGN
jgi:hypothetical protein